MATPSDPMHRRLAAARAAASQTNPLPAEPRPTTQGGGTTLEARLLQILDAPPDASLTVREAFARKETALYDAIAAAPMLEVWHLHKRVSVGRSDDRVLNGLARLAPDRRAKVIAFMGDARRREALRSRAA